MFKTGKALLVIAVCAALLAGAIVLAIAKRRVKRNASLPARGLRQPGDEPSPTATAASAPRHCEKCGRIDVCGGEYCVYCGWKLK